MLADLDEGEHTDYERLSALARCMRRRDLVVAPATQDEPTEA